jgi:hypothetical protein
MILFVLEGERPDLKLYRTMMEVCGVVGDTIAVVYGCNIDALYHEMIGLGDGADIVELLRDKYEGTQSNPFEGVSRSDQFSEVYLFFDYDFHDVNRPPQVLNGQLEYLLDYFGEETDHGKLYINYPMIESIRYTKELPDSNYYQYTVSREDCRSFKRVAASFSFYPNMDFLLRGDAQSRAQSWELLKIQNVAKANFICNGVNEYPPVEMGSISQRMILQRQIDEFESLPDCRLSVLSSYPIMLFEWLGK